MKRQKTLISSSSGGPIIARRPQGARGKGNDREAKDMAVRRLRRLQPQRPIGGAIPRRVRLGGPTPPILPPRTKSVARDPKIMICRGRLHRRRRSKRPRLTRTRPSPSFSNFVPSLRNKPTNADSCAGAAEVSTAKRVGRWFRNS
jgi:hypothetical protein